MHGNALWQAVKCPTNALHVAPEGRNDSAQNTWSDAYVRTIAVATHDWYRVMAFHFTGDAYGETSSAHLQPARDNRAGSQ